MKNFRRSGFLEPLGIFASVVNCLCFSIASLFSLGLLLLCIYMIFFSFFLQEKKLSEDNVKDLSSDLQVTWCFCLLNFSVLGTWTEIQGTDELFYMTIETSANHLLQRYLVGDLLTWLVHVSFLGSVEKLILNWEMNVTSALSFPIPRTGATKKSQGWRVFWIFWFNNCVACCNLFAQQISETPNVLQPVNICYSSRH